MAKCPKTMPDDPKNDTIPLEYDIITPAKDVIIPENDVKLTAKDALTPEKIPL